MIKCYLLHTYTNLFHFGGHYTSCRFTLPIITICLIRNIILIIKQALNIILNRFFCPHNVIITVTHTLINIYNFFMQIVCADCFCDDILKVFPISFEMYKWDEIPFFSPTPFCIVVFVHLSYCFLIFVDDQFSICHEQSHDGKDVFFHQFLSSSLRRGELVFSRNLQKWKGMTDDFDVSTISHVDQIKRYCNDICSSTLRKK